MEDNNLGLAEDLLELEGIEEARRLLNSTYIYKDGVLPLPRVTEIIKNCRDSTWLVQLAARVGYKFNKYSDDAKAIGTYVHSYIDEYLIAKFINKNLSKFKISDDIDEQYRPKVIKAVNNFLAWENNLNMMGYRIEEVVGLEITVSCPWYAGTIDAIMKINGAYYIIDFKTSKEISYEYLIQASAYMWIINNGYTPELPHIDGIGIIRVDKVYNKFEDYFLNLFSESDAYFLYRLQEAFISYVNTYYRNMNILYLYNTNRKEYNILSALESKGDIDNGYRNNDQGTQKAS